MIFLFIRFFVRSFVRREICLSTRKCFRRRENFKKESLGRRDRFRPKIVEIGAILAIFGPFEVSIRVGKTQSTFSGIFSVQSTWDDGYVAESSKLLKPRLNIKDFCLGKD